MKQIETEEQRKSSWPRQQTHFAHKQLPFHRSMLNFFPVIKTDNCLYYCQKYDTLGKHATAAHIIAREN